MAGARLWRFKVKNNLRIINMLRFGSLEIEFEDRAFLSGVHNVERKVSFSARLHKAFLPGDVFDAALRLAKELNLDLGLEYSRKNKARMVLHRVRQLQRHCTVTRTVTPTPTAVRCLTEGTAWKSKSSTADLPSRRQV